MWPENQFYKDRVLTGPHGPYNKDRVLTGPHGPFNYPYFLRAAQFLNAPYDSRKISRAPGARQCGGALKFSGLSIDFYGMLGCGAQKKE